MKATELRIGNWVQYNAFAGVVCSSDLFDIDKGIIKAQPIPLTEEWLTRFGFSLGDDGWYSICMPSGIFLAIEEDMYEVTVGQGADFSHTLIELNYVHQLQNLYFALTGEELNQNKEDE